MPFLKCGCILWSVLEPVTWLWHVVLHHACLARFQIQKLCDRVASSTLLDDRRDAVRALKSLSKVSAALPEELHRFSILL